MPLWHGKEFNDLKDTKEWWANSTTSDMHSIMGIGRQKRITWLGVATEIVTPGSSVFDPGCGTGLMIEALPEDTTYYGTDLNKKYVEEAIETYKDRPNTTFEVKDIYDVVDSDMMFDYTVITSLFGLFPLEETYKLMEGFWSKSRKGMSLTTLNGARYNPRVNRLTSHHPDQLSEFLNALPGVGEVKIVTEIPRERRSIGRGMAAYIWRA